MILCSIGATGVPHPMPMWFGIEPDGAIVMTTFTKSQKIRNLERDPRVSLLVEAGEEYAELQGVRDLRRRRSSCRDDRARDRHPRSP